MGLVEINDTLYKQLQVRLDADESIYDFLESKGFKPSKQMECIFHADRTPSMFINEGRGKWHCFSCGRGGGYVRLVTEYYRVVEGWRLDDKHIINELLKRNKHWQTKYGVKDLTAELKFSVKSLEYLLDCKTAILDSRKATLGMLREQEGQQVQLESGGNNTGTNLFSLDPDKAVWDEFSRLKDEEEIAEFLGKVQAGKIAF